MAGEPRVELIGGDDFRAEGGEAEIDMKCMEACIILKLIHRPFVDIEYDMLYFIFVYQFTEHLHLYVRIYEYEIR